jgi:hypothetical protein
VDVPIGLSEKYRQQVDFESLDRPTKLLYILIMQSGSVTKSSWAELSKIPDVSEINYKFF